MGNVERQRIQRTTDRPVIVVWHDAHASAAQWEHEDDLDDHEPYEVHSIGFLLATQNGGKRNHVSILQSRSREGYVDSILHIPKKMVVETILLERKTDANKCADSPDHPPVS